MIAIDIPLSYERTMEKNKKEYGGEINAILKYLEPLQKY